MRDAAGQAAIGELPGAADERVQGERLQSLTSDDVLPQGRVGGHFRRQRHGRRRSGRHAEMLGQRRPQVLPDQHVAVDDVVGLVGGNLMRRAEFGRTCDQPAVAARDDEAAAAGIAQRLRTFTLDRGEGAERGNDVHGAGHRMPEHDLRSQHAEGPGGLGLALAHQVFLQPVEVLVRMPRLALAARNRRRRHVAAIGLGTLHQRDVAQPGR